MARQSSSSASISFHLITIIYEAQGLRPWRAQDPVVKLVSFKLNPLPRVGTAEPGLRGSGGGGWWEHALCCHLAWTLAAPSPGPGGAGRCSRPARL